MGGVYMNEVIPCRGAGKRMTSNLQMGDHTLPCHAIGSEIRQGSHTVKRLELTFPSVVTTLPSPALWLEFLPYSSRNSPFMGTEEAEVERRVGWKTLLAYITGTVDQELLLRNEYLVTENRILRHRITGRVRLSDGERRTLAEIGKQLGKQALAEAPTMVKPDTILAWHR
jgi:hypothetical protein